MVRIRSKVILLLGVTPQKRLNSPHAHFTHKRSSVPGWGMTWGHNILNCNGTNLFYPFFFIALTVTISYMLMPNEPFRTHKTRGRVQKAYAGRKTKESLFLCRNQRHNDQDLMQGCITWKVNHTNLIIHNWLLVWGPLDNISQKNRIIPVKGWKRNMSKINSFKPPIGEQYKSGMMQKWPPYNQNFKPKSRCDRVEHRCTTPGTVQRNRHGNILLVVATLGNIFCSK